MTAVAMAPSDARARAGELVAFLETGTPPAGLFAPDVFLDFTMPTWRLQAQGAEDSLALRSGGHPGSSRVIRSRFDPTPGAWTSVSIPTPQTSTTSGAARTETRSCARTIWPSASATTCTRPPRGGR